LILTVSAAIALLRSSNSLWRNPIPIVASFFPGTLLRQSLLHSVSLAGLQVEGVALYILNNVFRLNLAFESPQSILQRLAFLQSDFGHSRHHQASEMNLF
jgi:hypothetical protein